MGFATATRLRGAPGAAVTTGDGSGRPCADATGPAPFPFTARTSNVYSTSLSRSLIVSDSNIFSADTPRRQAVFCGTEVPRA